jgi:hypothetical protein
MAAKTLLLTITPFDASISSPSMLSWVLLPVTVAAVAW